MFPLLGSILQRRHPVDLLLLFFYGFAGVIAIRICFRLNLSLWLKLWCRCL